MTGANVIARTWRGWVRTVDCAAYVAYIDGTGIAEYRRAPGNCGAWMLCRDLDDGRTEIVTQSSWSPSTPSATTPGPDPHDPQ
jgi:hypothetical protein